VGRRARGHREACPDGDGVAQPAGETSPALPQTLETALANNQDWRPVDPENLIIFETTKGRILIEILPEVAPAHAEQEWTEAEAFVVSNIIHIMLHEAGHAVIDRFGLPVIGQEEDAADSFATFEVLHLYDDHVDILLDAAEAMLIMHDLAEAGREPLDYFGVHDLDIQRGLRIVCHAYGLDPERYAEAARWVEMERDHEIACETEAEIAIDSWDVLLEPLLKSEGAAPITIEVMFGASDDYADEAAFLKGTGVLDDIASYLGETFDWDEAPTVSGAECGEPNAFYDPEAIELTMCYEFITELFALADER